MTFHRSLPNFGMKCRAWRRYCWSFRTDHSLCRCRHTECRRPWRRHVGDKTHWASAENPQSYQRVSDNYRQTNVGDFVGEPTHHWAWPLSFAKNGCFETRRQGQWWSVGNPLLNFFEGGGFDIWQKNEGWNMEEFNSLIKHCAQQFNTIPFCSNA